MNIYRHVVGGVYKWGFGFIDHLQVVATNKYNTTGISTLYEITLSLFRLAVPSLVFSRLLTMASSLLLDSSPVWTTAAFQLPSLHRLAFNWLAPKLEAIPHRAPIFSSQTNCPSYNLPLLVTSRHGPRRKTQFPCCMRIRCGGKVLTKPFPSSSRLILLIKNLLRSSECCFFDCF
jgi:hypothetical protein